MAPLTGWADAAAGPAVAVVDGHVGARGATAIRAVDADAQRVATEEIAVARVLARAAVRVIVRWVEAVAAAVDGGIACDDDTASIAQESQINRKCTYEVL